MRIRKLIISLISGIAIITSCAMLVATPTARAEEQTGVIKSVFPSNQTLDLTTGSQHQPNGQETNLGEIVLKVGQTVTDEGVFNKFRADEIINGQNVEYGIHRFSSSFESWYDTSMHPSTDIDYRQNFRVNQYGDSQVIDYNLATGTNNGTTINYSFTGVAPTQGYINVYYHFETLGTEAHGNELERLGWIGYRIKVIPADSTPTPTPTPAGQYGAYLKYNTNSGTLNGHEYTRSNPFEDMARRQSASTNYASVTVPLYPTAPTRDGYSFAFWYEPGSYQFNKRIFESPSSPINSQKYPGHPTILSSFAFAASNPDRTYTLDAVWDKDHSVTYDPNGGNFTPAPQLGTFGLKFENDRIVPNEDNAYETARPAISREGYTFLGWKDRSSGTLYAAGSPNVLVPFDEPHRVLVAQWEPQSTTPVTPPQPVVPTPNPNPSTPVVPKNPTPVQGSQTKTESYKKKVELAHTGVAIEMLAIIAVAIAAAGIVFLRRQRK
ncbi:hypothetical protein EJ419_02655 [Alloscardovia theropitheci]|uniref:InlB B-repeat-containing protein n=1 Tax=Alloscardovia theropitheci TaxID=2496842 RepID=A0A4R0QXW1_9BIFI|nr:InlB B-repeat-containing protein [Alloscardovia theropitheci]TCD54520.1 hypothetical protein EJ419_02655 [Alloscardovia theropitheci]